MRTREQLSDALSTATAVAGQLRLPLNSRVWRGQAGEFRGAGVGSSLDFQDHRDYSPGDDPRHINWQAYARTGQYTMKLYREEVRPLVDLFLDVSQSMWVDDEKAQRTAELLYFFTANAQKSGASLQVSGVLGDTVRAISLESIMTHHWIEEVKELAADDATRPPCLDLVKSRANAIRVFISDLLFEGEPASFLRSLHARQGSGIIFAPFMKSEADPGWTGTYDFIDAEKESRHPHQISPGVLDRYLKAYRNHFSLWEQEARRFQVSLARIDCGTELFSSFNQQAVRTGALEISP